MSRVDEVMKQKELFIMDGAMATELERKGLDLNDSLWSAKVLAEQPEAIRDVHYDYFVNGADCSTSASYQATVAGYEAKGYSKEEAKKLIARSMEMLLEAREAWWEKEGKDFGRCYPLAAASIGPYGAYLADGSEYTGNYHCTEEEYRDFHFERMKILKEAGADIFAVETMPRLDEAVACAKMLEELECDYWISFSFSTPDRINDGTTLETVVEKLKSYPHLKFIGVNCTAPMFVEQIIRTFKTLTDIPICAYPNRGEEYDPVTKTWRGPNDGKTYLDWAKEWYRAGASAIGGCCRTKPEDIRQIYEWSKEEHPRMKKIDYKK